MPSIQEHKQRILSIRGDAEADKLRHKDLVENYFNYTGTLKLKYIETLDRPEINEYLRMVIETPTLLATDIGIRWWIHQRVSYLMEYNNYLIDEDIEPILAQYFDWLKERDDYVESSEDKEVRIIKERIIDRSKIVRSELIETLYHPDRCEKMYAIYGEVWADIHMPY